MGDERSDKEAKQPDQKPKRVPHPNFLAHAFKPGHGVVSPGRPKGLASRIRELTNDGQDLIDILLEAATGLMDGIRPRDRIEATKMLLERGYGKPVEIVKTEGGPSTLQLTAEHMEMIARALTAGSPSTGSTLPVRASAEIVDAQLVTTEKD